jgi:hypothetical protein
MARLPRQLIDENIGGYHIFSRTVRQEYILDANDKNVFVSMMLRYARAYFIKLHSFCVMDNHFHLLVTMDCRAAERASKIEIAHRYWVASKGLSEIELVSKKEKKKYLNNIDIEKLKQRLCSISRFVQDLKQSFSRYHNKKSNVKGHLWAERFGGVLISHGLPQLICSAYIDLNPVKAGLAKTPEYYPWCTLGLRKRKPVCFYKYFVATDSARESTKPWSWYKVYAYEVGKIENRASGVSDYLVKSAIKNAKKLSKYRLSTKLPNLCQGLAFGSKEMIEELQLKLGRVFKRARCLNNELSLFVTRIYGGCT